MLLSELLGTLSVPALGYGAGKLFPLTEEDYAKNPDPSAWSPAWKLGLTGAGIGAAAGAVGGHSMKIPGKEKAALALIAGLAGSLDAAATGGFYGISRRNEKAQKKAASKYQNPLSEG